MDEDYTRLILYKLKDDWSKPQNPTRWNAYWRIKFNIIIKYLIKILYDVGFEYVLRFVKIYSWFKDISKWVV